MTGAHIEPSTTTGSTRSFDGQGGPEHCARLDRLEGEVAGLRIGLVSVVTALERDIMGVHALLEPLPPVDDATEHGCGIAGLSVDNVGDWSRDEANGFFSVLRELRAARSE